MNMDEDSLFVMVVAYCTSRSSDLDMLKPSSWLIIRLQRDFLPRPRMSSRDEAEAGKQKVTLFCTKRDRETAAPGLLCHTAFTLTHFQPRGRNAARRQAGDDVSDANHLEVKVLTGIVPAAAD